MYTHIPTYVYIYIFCNPSLASVSVDFQSVSIDSSIASSASRVSLRLSVNPGHYFLSHVPPTPAPHPDPRLRGGGALPLSSPGALSVFVLGFHACCALITLYLPRADTCLCLCGLLAGLDHLFTRGRISLLVTLHANARPRAPSTRLRAAARPRRMWRRVTTEAPRTCSLSALCCSGSLKCQRAKSIIRRKRARL